MSKKGLLVVLSGFAGSGKGTLMKTIVDKYNRYVVSISATTRNPRPGERDGKEYFFKTVQEFENLIKENKLIEYAKYVDNYYGTPKEYVDNQLEAGKDVFLEIEIQGALQIKDIYKEAILIFVMPPSVTELKSRLEGRGTEDSRTIDKRMSRSFEEAQGIDNYDYLLINNNIDECVEELHHIIISEHLKVKRNKESIKMILDDFSNYNK